MPLSFNVLIHAQRTSLESLGWLYADLTHVPPPLFLKPPFIGRTHTHTAINWTLCASVYSIGFCHVYKPARLTPIRLHTRNPMTPFVIASNQRLYLNTLPLLYTLFCGRLNAIYSQFLLIATQGLFIVYVKYLSYSHDQRFLDNLNLDCQRYIQQKKN